MKTDLSSGNSVRSCHMVYDFVTSVSGAVLCVLGNTKVLCTVSLQKGVPPFLRNSGQGWLTAEYAMLPNATMQRTQRESSLMQRNGRTVEISRLIGRALRTVVDVSHIGENTIYVDCDVLQADGGTRSAAITGASIALELAQRAWLEKGIIKSSFLKDRIAAVSVGIMGSSIILDPDYAKDCLLNADFNVIMTATGKLIELHGGAEKEPIGWDQFEKIRAIATKGIETFFQLMEKDLGVFVGWVVSEYKKGGRSTETVSNTKPKNENYQSQSGLFSLGNRLQDIRSENK